MINKEAFHNMEMSSAENYAWSSEGDHCTGLIIKPLFAEWEVSNPFANLLNLEDDEEAEEALLAALEQDDGPTFENIHTFELPAGSACILDIMAKGTMSCIAEDGIIKNSDQNISTNTFCLGELLTAAYPRNTRTGILKQNSGALFLGGDWEEYDDEDPLRMEQIQERAMFRMYAGVGVILMRETNKALSGGLLTDDEVVMTSDKEELLLTILPI